MKLADLFSVTSSFKLYETEKMYSGSLPRRTVDPDKALLMTITDQLPILFWKPPNHIKNNGVFLSRNDRPIVAPWKFGFPRGKLF